MTCLPSSRSGRSALEVAVEAAEATGILLLQHYSEQKRVEHKPGRANIVTDVDLLAERTVMEILRDEYPGYEILSEESSDAVRDFSHTWIVDPIDGTNNYVFGVPFFCVALALVYRDEIALGLIYDPVRREMFHAEKGKGAFLNGRPISVSRRALVKTSFIGCDMGYVAEDGARMIDIIRGLWPDMHGFRVMGSAALGLAYVACGRLDLYVHPCLYPWDSSGGILLINEAGGKIADWAGEPATCHSKRLIGSNKLVHEEFVRLAWDRIRVSN